MNLPGLIEWCRRSKNLKTLRENIQKETDPMRKRGMEGDINMCLCLLGELEKRALLVIEHTKKAEKYYQDIEEYLNNLRKRGVIYNIPENTKNPVTLPGADKDASPKNEKDDSKTTSRNA